ncbi:NAD(P)-dependent oxidoreductase [Bacteroidia bacterium]|nr:NAD(P)-dependent oxidoreductase [Bacteroidia bacterium]
MKSEAKILVTGANGQLGNELRALAAQHSAMQFVFTDLPQVDITNAQQISEEVMQICPQVVINCAAYTAVDKAESDPAAAALINAAAVQHLAAACAAVDAYLIHISTDYVFDGLAHTPYREEDATHPQTVYGITKLQGEKEALKYAKSIVVRTAWLYSSWGNNFVKTMLRLGSSQPCVRVVADQVGTPTYAADLAAALLQIVCRITAQPANFVGGVFHYTNAGVCSWYDFAVDIMQRAHLACTVQAIATKDFPTPAKRPAYSVLHKQKIVQCYGVSVPHWQASLEKCLRLLLK